MMLVSPLSLLFWTILLDSTARRWKLKYIPVYPTSDKHPGPLLRLSCLPGMVCTYCSKSKSECGKLPAGAILAYRSVPLVGFATLHYPEQPSRYRAVGTGPSGIEINLY
jgi:hypothetical protein